MKGISHLLLVDAMFGKLGRFLRILGIDTLIGDSAWSDTQLLAQARATNRVLITRDSAFYQRTQKFTLNDTPPPHEPKRPDRGCQPTPPASGKRKAHDHDTEGPRRNQTPAAPTPS